MTPNEISLTTMVVASVPDREEPAKADTRAHDRRALQQLTWNRTGRDVAVAVSSGNELVGTGFASPTQRGCFKGRMGRKEGRNALFNDALNQWHNYGGPGGGGGMPPPFTPWAPIAPPPFDF